MNLEDVSITEHGEPVDFYNELRRLIRSASDNLILSALYLGSGTKEEQLLQDVSLALNENQKLNVTFILDHSRARRGGKSSIDLLAPLVDQYYPRVQVCFYQMPTLKKAPYAWLPYWLQEVVAVYHCKFCVADNTVLITGANLSNDYFTDRQDRYWTISSSPSSEGDLRDLTSMNSEFGAGPLAQYLRDFSNAIALDSWKMQPGGRTLQLPTSSSRVSALQSFLHAHPAHHVPRHPVESKSGQILAFPIVQHSALHVEQEKEFFLQLLKPEGIQQLTSASLHLQTVQICTPYTNFPKALCKNLHVTASSSPALPSSPAVHVQIIGPSPRCHGFAGGQGFKEELPYIHEAALYARLFKPKHRSHQNEKNGKEGAEIKDSHSNIEWRQYDRPGWTLHRKGLWLNYRIDTKNERDNIKNNHIHVKSEKKNTIAGHFADEPAKTDNVENLWATYIGSSNFGERSWSRDLELGFFFLEQPRKSAPTHTEATHPSVESTSALQSVLRRETSQLVSTSRLHLSQHHNHTHHHPQHHYYSQQNDVSRIADHEKNPLLSTATDSNHSDNNSNNSTHVPEVLAAKQHQRAHRFHIRALSWLLRSVL